MPDKPSQTVTVTLRNEGVMCYVPVTFDPKQTFGKVRAPVKVTLNGYSYASTIFSMGGLNGIPLRKSHRQAAGLEGNETLTVTIALDNTARTVKIPLELARAFRSNRTAAKAWKGWSYTRQREHAEAIGNAKKPETRARRLANTLRALEGLHSRSHGDRR